MCYMFKIFEINLENLGIDVVQSAIDGAIVSGILRGFNTLSKLSIVACA